MITINQTELYPSTFSVSITDVDAVQQTNALGELLRDTVGVKRALNVSFNALPCETVQDILAALEPGFFDVTYPDPLDGPATRIFFVDSKDIGMYQYNDGAPVWQGLSFKFTER